MRPHSATTPPTRTAPRNTWLAAIAVAIVPARPALAGDADLCYVIADTGGGNGGNDLLFSVDRVTGTTTTIGTGTYNIEAAEYEPFGDRLLAPDANRLGRVDLTTGEWSAIGPAFGTGSGSAGNVAFTDVDSLAMDPFTGILYGVHRRGGSGVADALFVIDPDTGLFVPGMFSGGADYVLVQPQAGLADIDDLGISSLTREMYAIANNSVGDHLVQVDRFTGATVDISRLTVGGVNFDDVEGFDSDSFGTLWAAHGRAPYNFYTIDPTTATATAVHPIATGGDHESLGCLTGDGNRITGTVFHDVDGDTDLGRDTLAVA